MTSLFIRYREIQAQINMLQAQLAAIETQSEFLREKEFLEKLEKLMSEYGKDLSSILSILEPESDLPEQTPAKKRGRHGVRKRVTYRNPHTGETLTTAGGNNRVLKEWKKHYPSENIKTWIVGDN